MKYFVVDTNIIIKEPSILTKWNANYTVIIPNFVIEELHGVRNRKISKNQKRIISDNLFRSIEDAEEKGFINIYREKIVPSDKTFNDNYGQRLAFVDLQLLQLCLKLSDEKKEVILVTNDTPLRAMADNYGIKTYDLFQMMTYVSKLKTTNLNELKRTETIQNYLFRGVISNIIAGIISITFVFLINGTYEWISSNLNIGVTILLLFGLGVLFFLFRTNFRLVYGLLEYGFGFYISITIFTNKSFNYNDIGVVEIIQIMAGIYVMVRGLNNVDDGIKGTQFEPTWKKITDYRKLKNS